MPTPFSPAAESKYLDMQAAARDHQAQRGPVGDARAPAPVPGRRRPRGPVRRLRDWRRPVHHRSPLQGARGGARHLREDAHLDAPAGARGGPGGPHRDATGRCSLPALRSRSLRCRPGRIRPGLRGGQGARHSGVRAGHEARWVRGHERDRLAPPPAGRKSPGAGDGPWRLHRHRRRMAEAVGSLGAGRTARPTWRRSACATRSSAASSGWAGAGHCAPTAA